MSGVGADLDPAPSLPDADPGGEGPLRMLVGHDAGKGGDDALALARLLGGGGEATAVVELVVPLGPRDQGEPPLRRPERARSWDELCTGLRQAGRDALSAREMVVAHDDQLIADQRVVIDDSPARALSIAAEDLKVDAVVIGSTHRGMIGRLWPGATADRLLNGCARPVAQAPRGYAGTAPPAVKSIGVGFDGSPESCRALALAVRLAKRHGARLQLIAAVEPGGFADGEILGETLDVLSGEGLHDRRAEALRSIAEREAAVYGELGRQIRIDVAHAEPADLLQTATRGAVDLLVLGSRRYGPVGRVLLGSVSSKVLRGAAAPVLVATR